MRIFEMLYNKIKKKASNITSRRLIALLLAISMMPVSNAIGVVSVEAFGDYTTIGVNGVEGYNEPLYIFNNNYYTSEDGEILQSLGSGLLLTGTNDNLEVFVGDSDNADENAQPINSNIELGLENLHISDGCITINKVSGGEAFVNMLASGDVSDVNHIKLTDGARLSLTAAEDLTISVLELGDDSTFTVKAVDGAVIDIGSVSGYGVKKEKRKMTSAEEEIVIDSEDDLQTDSEETTESESGETEISGTKETTEPDTEIKDTQETETKDKTAVIPDDTETVKSEEKPEAEQKIEPKEEPKEEPVKEDTVQKEEPAEQADDTVAAISRETASGVEATKVVVSSADTSAKSRFTFGLVAYAAEETTSTEGAESTTKKDNKTTTAKTESKSDTASFAASESKSDAPASSESKTESSPVIADIAKNTAAAVEKTESASSVETSNENNDAPKTENSVPAESSSSNTETNTNNENKSDATLSKNESVNVHTASGDTQTEETNTNDDSVEDPDSVVDIGKDIADKVKDTETADSVTDSSQGENEESGSIDTDNTQTGGNGTEAGENTESDEESVPDKSGEQVPDTSSDKEETTENTDNTNNTDGTEDGASDTPSGSTPIETEKTDGDKTPSEEDKAEAETPAEDEKTTEDEKTAEDEKPVEDEKADETAEEEKAEKPEEETKEDTEETEDTEYETVIVSDFDKPETKGNVVIKEGGGEIRIGGLNVCSLSSEGGNVKLSGDAYVSESFILSYTHIQGADTEFILGCDASISDGKISDFTFFGYDKNETQNRTITFANGTSLSNVSNFGADENAKAVVRLSGIAKLGKVENSVLVSDFDIRYYNGAKKLEDMQPSMYRAAYIDKEGTIDHLCGTFSNGVFSASTTLPVIEPIEEETPVRDESSEIMLLALSAAEEVEDSENKEFEGWYVNGNNNDSYLDLMNEGQPVVSKAGAMTLNAAQETSLVRSDDYIVEITDGQVTSASYETVTFTDSASLKIDIKDANGAFAVSGKTQISGNLVITGRGTVTFRSDVTVGGYIDISGTVNVVFENDASLTIGGGSFGQPGSTVAPARDYSSVSDATITGASFFGFGNTDSGTATLELSNTVKFENVDRIGVSDDANTVLTLVTDNTHILSLNSTLYYDLPLKYYDMAGNELTDIKDSFTHYRVKADSDGNITFDGASELTLPGYTEEGYEFIGWATELNSETGFKKLSVLQIGTTELYAVQKGAEITVNYSLDFVPTDYTTDLTALNPAYNGGSESKNMGTVLTLGKIYRFGYTQIGWDIVDTEGAVIHTIDFPEGQDTVAYTIVSEHLSENSLNLKAKWETKTYSVKYRFVMPYDKNGNQYSIDSLRVKCDASNGELKTFTELASLEGVTAVFSEGNAFQVNDVPYGSTFEDFLNLAGLSGFDAVVVSDEENGLFTLDGNTTASGIIVDNDVKFIFGEENGQTGYFGKVLPEGWSLQSFDNSLNYANLTIFTPRDWYAKQYDIKFTNIDTALKNLWKVYVDGEDKTEEILENKTLTDIGFGTDITFKVPVSSTDASANFGLWNITAGGSFVEAKENTFSNGDEYYTFSFAMPEMDVNASFNKENVIVNLKRSPVTEQVINVNGRERRGFWTSQRLENINPLLDMVGGEGYGNAFRDAVTAGVGYCDGAALETPLQYYYEHPYHAALYITTGDGNISYPESAADIANGINTAEEIKGKNGTQNQIRLYNGLSGFSNASRGAIYLVDCHLWATTDYSSKVNAGNVNVTSANANVTITNATNTSTNISIYHSGGNNIIGGIYANGGGQTHFLGTAVYTEIRLGQIYAPQSDIGNTTFLPYESEVFPDKSGILLNYARCLSSSGKDTRIITPNKTVKLYDSTGRIDFVHVKDYYHNLSANNAVIIVEGNVYGGSQSPTISGNSVVIVKGTVTGFDNATLNLNGGLYLVLGNRLEATTLKMNGGILLTNAIGANNFNISGGTTIVNSIRNQDFRKQSAYLVNQNGDNDFIPTYKYGSGTSTFSGGDIYVMADYASTNRGSAETVRNTVLKDLLTESVTSRLDNSMVLTYEESLALAEEIKTSVEDSLEGVYNTAREKNTQNESFVLGYSAKNDSFVNITGSNIYSAGRMTLFNTTNISGGYIETPILSCKQDMTISDGTINTSEIGNSANILFGEVGQKYYAKTFITGGTINGVERLGAVTPSTAYTSTVVNRSYVTVGEDAVINTADSADIPVDRDIYINYPINSAKESYYNSLSTANKANYTFTIPDSAAEYIPMRTSGNPNDFENLIWSSGSGSFGKPTEIANPELSYSWTIEDGEEKLTAGYEENKLIGSGLTDTENNLLSKDHLSLFPYIVIPRNLKIYQDSEIIDSFAVNSEVQSSLGVGYNNITVNPNDSVVFTLNKDMKNKVVYWYKDEFGVYHNLMTNSTVSDDGLTVSITMPNLDNVELYICDEIPLYFNKMDIQINNDGFNVEIDPTREDAKFKYLGGLYISRDDGKIDYLDKKIVVSENYVRADGRPVTLNQYNCALDIRENADVLFYLDGKQYSPDHKMIGYNAAAIEFVGKNEGRTDGWDAIAYLDIGTTKKVTFRNLTFSMTTLTITNGTVNTLEVIDCNVPQWGNNLNYAADVPNVYIENSHIFVCNENGIQRAKAHCTMTIKNSTITSSSNNIFSCEGWSVPGGNVILDNTRVNCPGDPYYQPITGTDRENEIVLLTSLTLKNGSIFYNPTSFRISESLTIDENSKLYVGVDSENHSNGRVLTPTITVKDGGSLDAKYVVCAGYGTTATVTKGNADGILVDGGGINAYFVGGDNGAVINMTSGEISTTYLGTMGKYIYNDDVETADEIEFTIDSMVCNSKISLTNGTVNIADGGYIGGGDSAVSLANAMVTGSDYDITGKSVSISNANIENADNIISDSDIPISGENTTITASTMEAKQGTVSIAGGSNVFENPLNTPTTTHNNVSVKLSDSLLANNILIKNGAYVYAKTAVTNSVDGNSSFVVEKDGRLYTRSYGSPSDDGTIRDYIPVTGEDKEQNIWGRIAYPISYNLGLEDESIAPTNNNPNVYYNDQGALYLENPTHPAFDFKYWLSGEDIYTGADDITQIVPSSGVLRLKAVWEPCKVKFKVRIKLSDEEAQHQTEGISSIHPVEGEAGVYEWDKTTEITYGEYITGENGKIQINDYPLNTKKATVVQVYNEETGTVVTLPAGSKLNYDHIEWYREKTETDANATLYIYLAEIALVRTNMVFDLNKASNMTSVTNTKGVEFVNDKFSVGMDFGRRLNEDADICTLVNGGISAVGYTFMGWSSQKLTYSEFEALSEAEKAALWIDITKVVDENSHASWYAIWQPNDYYVEFSAVPHSKTPGTYFIKQDDATMPADTDAGYNYEGGDVDESLTVKYLILTYDNGINTGEDTVGQTHNIPTAWMENHQFTKWYYIGADNAKHYIDSSNILNGVDEMLKQIDFSELPTYDEGKISVAITFYAEYEPAKIVYNSNGGFFVGVSGNKLEQNAASVGSVLSGYKQNGENIVIEDDSGEGVDWQNGNYAEGSYRYFITNPGYTFTGWYDKNGEIAYKSPRFNHLEVTARWRANKYNLNLHAYHSDKNYNGVKFAYLDSNGHKTTDITKHVTLEQIEIGTLLNQHNVPNWPARDKWGTYYTGDADSILPRPLWGFSLFPFDPVHTASPNYIRYNTIARNMFDRKQILVKSESQSGGMKFELNNMEIMKDILDSGEQNDYSEYLKIIDVPDGADLNLYAIYREYALVFAEMYFVDGTEMLETLKTVSYGMVDNEDLNEPDPKHGGAAKGGLGWFVNTKTYDPTREYSPETFMDKFTTYKAEAKSNGEYDIFAYYLYAGKGETDKVALRADKEAQKSETVSGIRKETITLPDSILSGVVRCEFEADADLPDFVTKDVIEADLYKAQISSGGTPDNTVALVVKKGSKEYTLVKEGNSYRFKDGNDYLYAEGGDDLEFILYHSYVMTEETKYNFKMTWEFDYKYADNRFEEIPGQYYNINDFEIALEPSVYTLQLQSGYFSDDNTTEKTGTLKEIFGYPRVAHASIGEYHSGWRMVGGSAVSGSTYTEIAHENGVITLTPIYEVVTKNFKVSKEVAELWDITVGGTEYTSGSAIDLDLNYGTTITFTKKSGVTTYPEFILKNGERSFRNTSNNDTFTFRMPAMDVKITFDDIEEIKLTKSLNIEETQYTYGDNTSLWRGRYLVYSDSNTEKKLTIDGNFINGGTVGGKYREREIKIGPLGIDSGDSIVLQENSKANLTLADSVSVKNILTENNAVLNIVGEGKNLTLNPAANKSAIGNHADGAGSEISVSNCNVLVKPASAKPIKWFGGINVSSVTLNKVDLDVESTANLTAGSFIAYAGKIDITDGSEIGDAVDYDSEGSKSLTYPIYAKNVLNVSDSTIYMNYIVALDNMAPIGTEENGKTNISDSDIYVTASQTQGNVGNTYRHVTGDMHITGQSSVNVFEYEIVDVANTSALDGKGGKKNFMLVGQDGGDLSITNSPNVVVLADTDTENYVVSLNSITYSDNTKISGTGNSATLKLVGDLSGTGDLTLANINIKALNVGSIGGADNKASTVELKNVKITAATLGALGEHNRTFTYVTQTGTNDLTGVGAIVQDWYRIKYELDRNIGLNIPGDFVFRTSTGADGTYTIIGGYEAPETLAELNEGNSLAHRFGNWYFLGADGTTQYSFADTATKFSKDLFTTAKLASNADGTKTLSVYAEPQADGTAYIKNGRLFAAFDDKNKSVTISSNSAWTVMLNGTNSHMPGFYYQLNFSQPLPSGARLTLIMLGDSNKPTGYYGYVASEGESVIHWSKFVKMGTTDAWQPPNELNTAVVDKMIVSVDFSDVKANTQSGNVSIDFKGVVGNSEKTLDSLSYTVSSAIGSVTATESKVTVVKPENSIYQGKDLCLVAEITGPDVPLTAEAKLADNNGVLIDGNKFVFDIAQTDGEFNYSISGIRGSYLVTWHLTLKNDGTNVLNDIIASSESVSATGDYIDPYLSATLTGERTLPAGKEYTATIAYETNQTNVSVSTQKQGTILAAFDETDEITATVSDGNIIAVNFPAETSKGVYRICISINENSKNDNVYFTFVVR